MLLSWCGPAAVATPIFGAGAGQSYACDALVTVRDYRSAVVCGPAAVATSIFGAGGWAVVLRLRRTRHRG